MNTKYLLSVYVASPQFNRKKKTITAQTNDARIFMDSLSLEINIVPE